MTGLEAMQQSTSAYNQAMSNGSTPAGAMQSLNSAQIAASKVQANVGQQFLSWLSGTLGQDKQIASQKEANELAYERNVASAREQREWELFMDSTKTQRLVKDLEAAGLNPWLALQGASFGGGVPVGASASTNSGQMASSSSGSSGLAALGTAAVGIAAMIKLVSKLLK